MFKTLHKRGGSWARAACGSWAQEEVATSADGRAAYHRRPNVSWTAAAKIGAPRAVSWHRLLGVLPVLASSEDREERRCVNV